MTSDTSFGVLIKARRVALGMSQAALAELVGRSASAIRTWERGSSTPTDESVVRSISAVLGIEEDNLRASVGLPPIARDDEETVGGATLDDFVGGPDPHGGRVPSSDIEIAAGREAAEGEETEKQLAQPAADLTDEAFGESSERPMESEEQPRVGSHESAEPFVSGSPPFTEEEAPHRDEPEVTASDGDPGAMGPVEEPVPHRADAENQQSAPTWSAARERDVTVIEPVSAGVAGTRTATTRTVRQPAVATQRSYLDDPDQMTTYWIRAALTVAFTVFLLIVLFWALGRLGDSLGEVWEIFKAGA